MRHTSHCLPATPLLQQARPTDRQEGPGGELSACAHLSTRDGNSPKRYAAALVEESQPDNREGPDPRATSHMPEGSRFRSDPIWRHPAPEAEQGLGQEQGSGQRIPY